jgi:hypothetical protein
MFTKEEKTNQKGKHNISINNQAYPGMIENKTRTDNNANLNYFRNRNVGNNYLQSFKPVSHNVGQGSNSLSIQREPT